jgi:histidinol-phosphatase (PHP family)
MIDYHIHTLFSDGKDSHEDCLRMAAQYNMTEIGFSDHICLNFPTWAVSADKFISMRDEINKIKNIEELPFKVKFGVEMDYLPGKEAETKVLTEKLKFDYVIGSVHFINGWNFDTDPSNYADKNIDALYNDYFDLLQHAALSGLFDIIGHADVIKKFGYYPSFKLTSLYKKTARAFRKANVTIELNTSGIAKPCNEFYPSEEFLKICRKEKVPVTLGSDAHHATDIGRSFGKAITQLKAAGYKQIAVFENRNRSFISI